MRHSESVFDKLSRQAPIDDACFDRIFPDWAADLSRIHWTPLPVIRRSLELLRADRAESRILDVGSGVGKFCLAGAALSRAHFYGVEQRLHFVNLSTQLSDRYRISRVTFVHGSFEDIDWSQFDGVYLFNPFQEQDTPFQALDRTIALDRTLYRRYIESAAAKLEMLRTGSRVVTYWGFGGRMPTAFTCKAKEFCFRGPLECWVKE